MALGLSSPSFHALYPSPRSSSTSHSNRTLLSLPSLLSSFHGIRIQSCAVKTQGPSLSFAGERRKSINAAKREMEMKELRGRTTEELNEGVIDLKGELYTLRIQQAVGRSYKPSEFWRMKKRIARMLTIKREREIEQGISKRLSRKLDKKWRRDTAIRPPPSLREMQEEEKGEEGEEEQKMQEEEGEEEEERVAAIETEISA